MTPRVLIVLLALISVGAGTAAAQIRLGRRSRPRGRVEDARVRRGGPTGGDVARRGRRRRRHVPNRRPRGRFESFSKRRPWATSVGPTPSRSRQVRRRASRFCSPPTPPHSERSSSRAEPAALPTSLVLEGDDLRDRLGGSIAATLGRRAWPVAALQRTGRGPAGRARSRWRPRARPRGRRPHGRCGDDGRRPCRDHRPAHGPAHRRGPWAGGAVVLVGRARRRGRCRPRGRADRAARPGGRERPEPGRERRARRGCRCRRSGSARTVRRARPSVRPVRGQHGHARRDAAVYRPRCADGGRRIRATRRGGHRTAASP